MPLTPFHWGIVLFGLLFFDLFYLPALILSSVVLDVEPFYYLFISPTSDFDHHGVFHSYIGATIIGLIAGFVLVKSRKYTDSFMARFKISQSGIPEKFVYFSSLFAAYSHIFFDSFIHADMEPLWPFTTVNPFLGAVSPFLVYLILILMLVVGGILFAFRFTKNTSLPRSQ